MIVDRKLITPNVRLCLRHVLRDQGRRAVPLREPRLVGNNTAIDRAVCMLRAAAVDEWRILVGARCVNAKPPQCVCAQPRVVPRDRRCVVGDVRCSDFVRSSRIKYLPAASVVRAEQSIPCVCVCVCLSVFLEFGR